MPARISRLFRLLLTPSILFALGVAHGGCGGPDIVGLECGDGRVDSPEVCDEGANNGTPNHCRADCSGVPRQVRIEGDILPFMSEVGGERLAGVKITVLERPELSITAGADGHFTLEGLDEGSDVTLVAEHDKIQKTQTATIRLGPNGVNPFAVQVVPKTLYNALKTLMPLPVEEDKYCAIATTAARLGGTLYTRLRQGAAGTTATLSPAVSQDSGPIYFNEDVIPDPKEPATSKDGGLLFYRLPPGDYVLHATRENTSYNELRFHCTAGALVNAGPTVGLLADIPTPDLNAGLNYADDVYSASSDALCAQTAACVNKNDGEGHYPDAMLTSCKAVFRNLWASIDVSCDSGLRDAGKALFDCRAASCELAQGGDSACATEDAAWNQAQLAYGACLLKSRPDLFIRFRESHPPVRESRRDESQRAEAAKLLDFVRRQALPRRAFSGERLALAVLEPGPAQGFLCPQQLRGFSPMR